MSAYDLYNLPWPSDHLHKNINSVLHDYLAVMIQTPHQTVHTNFTLYDENTNAIKLGFNFIESTDPAPGTIKL